MPVTRCFWEVTARTNIAYYPDGTQYLQVGRIKCDIRYIRLDIISVLNQLHLNKTVQSKFYAYAASDVLLYY